MTRIAAFPTPLLLLLAAAALGTVACGGERRAPRSAGVATSPSPGAPSGALETAAEESPSSTAGAPLPAPPAAARAEDSSAPADRAYEAAREKQRPGLGTEWGETRDSRVSSAHFERQDFERPLSTTSFFYNDESGVRALLGSGYWDRRTDGISAARGAVTIRLVDDSGSTLPTFSAGGRSYVMGNDGARYVIRIQNQSSVRFEAVATVDGLDVIDGQPGSFQKRGYLVGPWSTLEIDGFRRSEDQVAAFRFGRVRDSYAARRGSDRNVGVIGVAIFHERGSSWPWSERELERRNSADAFPGRFAPAPPAY